jgi:integrase
MKGFPSYALDEQYASLLHHCKSGWNSAKSKVSRHNRAVKKKEPTILNQKEALLGFILVGHDKEIVTMGRRGHGEGSIYRRKDGRWAASITLENQRRKTYYGKTRKEVQEKLNAALHEQQQGTLATGKRQTVAHYLNHWLEEVHKSTIRLSSYDRYRKLLDRHILPELGHFQVQKLSAQQAQAFYARKLEGGLSPSTIHVMHAILHKALSNAVRWGLVSRNMCDIVSPPRQEHHEI